MNTTVISGNLKILFRNIAERRNLFYMTFILSLLNNIIHTLNTCMIVINMIGGVIWVALLPPFPLALPSEKKCMPILELTKTHLLKFNTKNPTVVDVTIKKIIY